MNVKDAIASRRSIRKYLSKPMPKETLDDLLEAARTAPSSNNQQRWSMVVVTDEETKRRLVPVSGNQRFVGDCSAYVVGVCDSGASYASIDITIALDHLSLRAVEMGLGTCWVGDFEPEKVKEILGIPEDREVPICMTVGYPAQSPAARKRKPPSELFRAGSWGQRYS